MTIHFVPVGGLEHPVFQGTGAKDDVLVVLQFPAAYPKEIIDGLWEKIEAWSATLERVDPQASWFTEQPWLSRQALRARLTNLRAPREAAMALLALVQAHGVDIKEAFFARWRQLPDMEIWGPVPDPRARVGQTHFDTPEAFMAAAFGLSQEPPPSEYDWELRGAFEKEDQSLLLEDRGAPLYWPGLRICYGLAPDAFVEPDERTSEIAEALADALDKAFSPIFYPAHMPEWRPAPWDHNGTKHRIDRLSHGGRTGYGFAIGAGDLMHVYTQGNLRYREYEVFDALARVIATKNLAPVVTWCRQSRPLLGPLSQPRAHIFQVWEREERPVRAPGDAPRAP